MAVNKLLLKRSAVAGKEPTTASLDLGELAINTVDGKVYLKKESGSLQTIVQLTDVSGSILSASYAQTSSFSNNFTVGGPLNVYGNGYISGSLTVTDTITAQRLVVQTITSSIIYSSGSNKFGDATSDTQEFTGSVTITGSLGVTGPTALTGSLDVIGNQNISTGYELNVDDVNVNTITDRSGGTVTLAASTSSVSGFLTVNNNISASGRIEATSFTGSFSGSLANLQGNPTYIPYFSSSQVLANSAMYQIGTSSIAINETNITVGAPEALYVFQTDSTSINVVTGKGNLNNYLQLNIQNTNQGASASSDIVATANNGNEFTNYIDMGINSEGFATNFIGGANDAYLYSIANNLHIGNANDNGTHVGFFVGGSDVEANNKLQLNPNNQHKMSGSLDVSGSITATSFITRGATAAQFVKGDGSLDSTTYVSASVFNSTTGSLNNFSASILLATASLYNATASIYNATASIYNATASLYNATASIYLATASLYNFSASILAYTASQTILNGTYATTGSNVFKGNQVISGSLTVSGSTNIFGTTNLTGSVNVSGSIGTAIIANADTIVFTGSYAQSGSVNINGNITASNALIGGRDYITDSSSFSTRVFNLEQTSASLLSATASLYNATASIYNATASLYNFSASILNYTSSNNAVVAQLYNETASLKAATASLYSATASIYAFSASINNFTSSTNNAIADIRVATASLYAFSASINSYTASNNAVISQLYNETASLRAATASLYNATASIYNATASLYAFSASINNYTASGNSAIAQLYNETASLKAATASLYSATSSIYNATQSLYAFSASINSYTASNNAVVAQLYNETASLKTATASLYSATASIYNATASIYNFSASILNYTASNNSTIAQLYNETASLRAATASLYAATASIYNATQSLYAFSASILNYTASQNILNGTYATTGSNIFKGNQTITGSVNITGSLGLVGDEIVTGNLTVTNTITAQKLVVQTVSSSVIYSSGSNVFGDELSDVQSFTGSVGITGSLTVNGRNYLNDSSSFSTRVFNLEQTSASILAATASIYNATASIYNATQSLYNATASIYNATASLYAFSASINNYTASNNAAISQLYNETASLRLATGSLYNATASLYAATSSLYNFSASILNFTASQRILNGTFATTASNNFIGNQTISGSLSVSGSTNINGTTNLTGSVNISGSSGNVFTANINSIIFTGSFVQSGSVNVNGNVTASNALIGGRDYLTDSSSFSTRVFNLEQTSASILAATASLYAATASLYNFSSSILSYTASNNATITQLYNETASLRAATASLYSATASLYNATASLYNFSASILNYTASNNATITQLYNETASLRAATASLYSATASLYNFSSSILNFTASQRVLNGTYATTGSNVFRGNQTVTGSLFTSGSNTLVGSTTLSGSVDISGSTTIRGTTNFSNSSTTITGSLLISGSTTQIGNNTLLGNTTLSGSITISGSQGPGNLTASVQIYGDIRQAGYHRFDPVTTNIDTSISASYIYVSGSTNDLYFSQNGGGYGNTTRLRWLEGNLYTGLLNGGLITTQSSTVYQISSGSGIIVNLNASFNNNPYPTVQYINWPNLSASIAPLSASYDQSFVAIDSTGNIFAQGTPYSNGQFNTEIPIGVVLHQNRSTINGVQTFASLAYGWKQRSSDFIRAFGPLKLSGLDLYTSSSRGLTVGSGTAWSDGRNYTVDPNNPSYITDTGTAVSKIFRYRQSGSAAWVYDTNAGAGYTTIDPTQYSNSGSLTSVGASNWSIQRVYWFPNSVTKAIYVYYGNAIYPTEAEAIANLQFEPFIEAPNTAAQAVYLGAIVINGTGVFTSANDYKILPAGLFRSIGGTGGGGSSITTTLAGLSDVDVAGVTDGQPLVYNATSLKWEDKSYISASISGNAASATTASFATTSSYAANAELLDGLNSTNFTLTSSFSAYTASLNNFSASVLNATASIYLTTASLNAFTASINSYTASDNARNTQLYNFSASILNYTASNNATIAQLYNETASVRLATGSLYAATASLYLATASLYNFSASILNFTASQRILNGTYATTASNTFNGSQIITGSLTVGQTVLGSNENTITVGLPIGGGVGEGGQILLAASGGLYTSASMLDNYQNRFRVLRGTNASSDAEIANFSMHTGLVQFNRYTGSGAFVGTTAAFLAVDTSGNILTSNLIPSASYASNADLLDGLDSSAFTSTGSFGNYTSSLNNFSASVLNATASLYNFSASILNYTASNNNNIAQLYRETASFQAATASIYNATASLYRATASLYNFSASILSYTASQNILNGTYATTGSNVFRGNQTITGSVNITGSLGLVGDETITGNLTVTNTITAQRLVVQTVSSSVIYSSGSNVFGNNLANTQVFTGSVDITGSLTVNGRNYLTDSSSFSTRVFNLEQTSASLLAATASLYNATASLYNATASIYLTTASLNAFTASINSYTASDNARIAQLYNFSASILNYTSSTNATIAQIQNATASLYNFSSSILSYTASNNATITQLYNETASLRLATGSLYAATASLYNFSASILNFTSSTNNAISDIRVATASLYNFSSSILNFTASQRILNGTYATTASNTFNGNQIISGSLTVFTGSGVEFQITNTGTKIGNIISDVHTVTGSLNVSGSITGSLFGTATTASYVLNAVSASFASTASSVNPLIQNVLVTGSISLSGSLDIRANNPILQVIDNDNTVRFAALGLQTNGGNWYVSNGDSTSTTTNDLWFTRGSDGSDNRVRIARDTYTLSVYTGSSENVRLNASGISYFNGGSVGIGTTSPTALLNISSSAAATTLLRVDSAAGAGTLFVSSSGNVGVGTTNPQFPLSFGSALGNKIALYDAGAANTQYGFGIQSSLLQIFANTVTDRVGIGYGNSTSFTETLTVKGANVGIGTSSPSVKLHVSGAALFENDNDAIVTIKSRTNAFNPTLRFQEDTSIIRWQLIAAESDGGKFKISGSGAGEALTIISNNNVGIGNTNPNAKLDVSGSTIISGSLTVITGSGVEFQVLDTGVKIGNAITDAHTVTGSLNVSGSITGSLFGTATTASYVLNAISSSFASTASNTPNAIISASVNIPSYDTIQFRYGNGSTSTVTINNVGTASLANTASYWSGSITNALSSSFALTASYALNAGAGGISAISIADEGILQGSASYFDFTGTGVTATVSAGTASINITGGGGSSGLSTFFTQSVAAVTWSFTHNLNTRTPLVQVYDSGYNQINPQYISASNGSTVEIGFGIATAGYAVASTGGTLYVTGSNVILDQSVAAATWSFNHNLNTKYPVFQVFNSSDEVIIPEKIIASTSASALIYFPVPVAGKAVASLGGLSGSFSASYADNANTASYALTASYAINAGAGAGFPYSGSAVITGSLLVSQSFVDFTKASYVTGSFTGSLLGTASYALFALTASTAPGYTVQFTQSVAAATWSFTHNMNTRNPIIQVYDSSYKQIIPNDIVGTSVNDAEIRFDYSTTGYVVMSNGGGLYVTGSTSELNQTSAATTWSFTHNLNSKYVAFEVYDSNDYVIIPAGIKVLDVNSAELYFAAPQTGRAVAQFSGINGAPNATSASFALTSSYATTLTLDRALLDYAQVNSSVVGSNNLYTQATGSYTAAFFQYTCASASNARAGRVTAVWNGTTVEFNDVSTADIGSTSPVTSSVVIVGTDVQFNMQTNTSGWRIKSTATFM